MAVGKKKQEEKIDFQAMMEVYQKFAILGTPHKALKSMAGNWTTRTKSWMEPGKPPMESTGTCKAKMLLGGRYLQQEYVGDMMGTTFKGINILGYDNYTKKYVSIWIDSMSTGIYFFEGKASRDGKTITQESRYDDPVQGPAVWRSVSRIVDENTIEYEMFMTGKVGKNEKMMEMTLTRKK